MSAINKYNNPVLQNWHIDEFGEPTTILRTNEIKQVFNGKIGLEEIPDSYRRVTIDGMVEVNFDQSISDTFHYKVDYANGIVFFHPSKELQNISISRYYGRGMFYIPSSRIWTRIDGLGNVVSTLADMEGNLVEISAQIEDIGNMASNAQGTIDSLKANVLIGTTLNSELQSKINTGTTLDTNLKASTISATNIKTTLDTSVTAASSIKATLDTSTSKANTAKSTLDTVVVNAEGLKVDLGRSISTGTTLKSNIDQSVALGSNLNTTLPSIVQTANTSKTNLESTIGIAGNSKTLLDASVVAANNINNTISNASTGSIKKATDINNSLLTNIQSGTTKISDIQTSINQSTNAKLALDTSISSSTTNKDLLDASIVLSETKRTALISTIDRGDILQGDIEDLIATSDLSNIQADITSLKSSQHTHANKIVLDKLTDSTGSLKYNGNDVGIGDMKQSVYDTNGDGKVNLSENSEKLGGQTISYFASAASIPTKTSQLINDSKYLAKGLTWGAFVDSSV